MKANQKILYDGFKKESVEGKSSIIRERCKKAAEEILKSFPDFEKKVEEKKTDSIKKEVKEKK